MGDINFFRAGEPIVTAGEDGKRWQVRRNLLSAHGEKWVQLRHYCVANAARSRSRPRFVPAQ